jgi:hypothetical protein
LGRDPEGAEVVPLIQEVGVIDLIPIMVLRSDPEEGEHRAPQDRREGLGQLHRRQGLIEAIKRSREQPRLLAGCDQVPSLLQEPRQTRSGGVRRGSDQGSRTFPGVSVKPSVHLLGLFTICVAVLEFALIIPNEVGLSLQIITRER